MRSFKKTSNTFENFHFQTSVRKPSIANYDSPGRMFHDSPLPQGHDWPCRCCFHKNMIHNRSRTIKIDQKSSDLISLSAQWWFLHRVAPHHQRNDSPSIANYDSPRRMFRDSPLPQGHDWPCRCCFHKNMIHPSTHLFLCTAPRWARRGRACRSKIDDFLPLKTKDRRQKTEDKTCLLSAQTARKKAPPHPQPIVRKPELTT